MFEALLVFLSSSFNRRHLELAKETCLAEPIMLEALEFFVCVLSEFSSVPKVLIFKNELLFLKATF